MQKLALAHKQILYSTLCYHSTPTLQNLVSPSHQLPVRTFSSRHSFHNNNNNNFNFRNNTHSKTYLICINNKDFLEQRKNSTTTYPAEYDSETSSMMPTWMLNTFALMKSSSALLWPALSLFSPYAKATLEAPEAIRMKERLSKHGFKERLVIPDGNCQMRALADQIFGTEEKYKDIRSNIIGWLKINEKYSIDKSSTLGDFLDREQFPIWSNYLAYMDRNGAWGDHITLLAAAETYGVTISILSNVEVPEGTKPDTLASSPKIQIDSTPNYFTKISPLITKPTKNVYLSHWHELHYNSLVPLEETEQTKHNAHM